MKIACKFAKNLVFKKQIQKKVASDEQHFFGAKQHEFYLAK